MRRVIASISVGLALLVAPAFMLPVTVHADPLDAACNAGGTASATCKGRTSDSPLTGSNGVLTKVTNVLALVGGIITVIMVVVGGFKYITSGGDSSATASAKNTIIYALIGLIVIVLARTIIGFVLSKI